MTIAEELVKILTQASKGSARSKQVRIGPSEIGGCARKTWLKLHNAPRTNPDTVALSAVWGTAIHSFIESAFHKQDPFGDKYVLEAEWIAGDLMGHVDLYDVENQEVVDWKTTTKKNLGSNFPSQQQRWQVQLYGYLMVANGKPVKNVTLVGIARDGDERHVVSHTEPYDSTIAEEALNWLKSVKETDVAPQPEKPARFCRDYCGFFDATGEIGCPSSGGR